ncbi:Laminin subunit gamma-3 [Liparis tanakae]|uniref:Laminin subunit gamma-3 n=1 Tax=Liparis tanakae TaxID=230148 RepID=A0A4Z2GJK0_9TELE|nr:Laminin subunit gamma-3 [Liparis tanakae]
MRRAAEETKARLQHLEKLLARFDCRGRFGKQQQQHQQHQQRHMTRMYEHEHQREDALPNALEDFLAFQEAREAFIKQFSSLEASAGTLLAQLHGITSTLNCSTTEEEEEEEEEEEGRKDGESKRAVCRTFTETMSAVAASHKRLKQAALDLDSVVIPFEAPSEPNQWNMLVNDSQALMRSHGEAADLIEAVASRAAAASERTWALLTELLQDNSTEEYISKLTEQITRMQQRKENLTAQVSDTAAHQLALEEEAAGVTLALGNITSSRRQLAPAAGDPSPPRLNQTQTGGQTAEWGEDLLKQKEELEQQIRTKDELLSKIGEEVEPLKQTARDQLEVVGDIRELQARAQGSKVTALSSVVAGKEVESDAIVLHRGLEHMAREWPRRQAQTKTALKKERPLQDKVLADVRKRLSQIEKTLNPALENLNLSSNTTKEAEQTAHAVAKESKAILIQAKHTRTASAHLSSHIDSALQQLAEQEMSTDTISSQISPQPEVSLTGVMEDMEAAKLQLEAYSNTLTQLISKIDGNVPLERFDRILDETARRLSTIRGSVESPTLGSKIQKLKSAAEEQHSRMSFIEQDLQEIREERDSLRDIALNLPQSCPQAT